MSLDHSVRKEILTVLVLSLGFGLVGLDRFLVSTMFPVIAKSLKLGYADIGVITGALAIAWGVASLFMGNLSDRFGRRIVLTGSLVLFSLVIGASGFAAGLGGLVAVRVVMGLADGAYTPASIIATREASAPRRHGLNMGIQLMMLPLCGLGLAPLIVAFLLDFIDWRGVFFVFVVPGLLLALAMWRLIPPGSARREHAGQGGMHGHGHAPGLVGDWFTVLRQRNIAIGSLSILCWMTCLITTSAFLPNYLLDHLGLDFTAMSSVMAAIGLGSMLGSLFLPYLSDRIGRKRVMVMAAAGSLVCLLALSQAGPQVAILFALLLGVHFFNNALITMTVGPICAESVPLALMATASGLVIAVGEIFGGGIAPMIVGLIARDFGIDAILWLPIALTSLGTMLCLFLVETGPVHGAGRATARTGDIGQAEAGAA